MHKMTVYKSVGECLSVEIFMKCPPINRNLNGTIKGRYQTNNLISFNQTVIKWESKKSYGWPGRDLIIYMSISTWQSMVIAADSYSFSSVNLWIITTPFIPFAPWIKIFATLWEIIWKESQGMSHLRGQNK